MSRARFNPKRRLADPHAWSEVERQCMADTCIYEGNPQHKKTPCDYGLTPPAAPRPGKSLCDGIRPITKDEAESLLRVGFKKGMVSERAANGWPKNVWSVDTDEVVYEAQLGRHQVGAYHGYPVPKEDPMRQVVLEEWKRR